MNEGEKKSARTALSLSSVQFGAGSKLSGADRKRSDPVIRSGSDGSARKRGRPKKEKKKGKKFSAPYFTQKFPLPVVYICAPYRWDEKNEPANAVQDVMQARKYCRFAVSRYCVPVAPHLLYPAFLRNSVVSERKIGNYCGLCLLDRCSEVWVFGDLVTNEMEWEVWRAFMRSKTIRWFTEEMTEIQKELPAACRSLCGPVKRKKRRKAS